MPSEANCRDGTALRKDPKGCVAEALSIFLSQCREEAEKGRRVCIAAAQFIRDERTVPLVLDSVEEAEQVKKLLLADLSKKNFQRCSAMVYKEGPYYHKKKKKFGLFGGEDLAYYLIKIKLSASW